MGYLNSVLSPSTQVHADDPPVSGGGLSQNGKFSYGYASSPGKRSSMEDFYETRIDGVEGEIVGLFGVFDGHGGARAAEYVKQNLFSNLIRHPKFISDTKSAIAIAVSRDHKPDQTDERQRIEEAGGFVMWAGTWRVGGVLAVSRAFGDRLLKQYVVADPEIQEAVAMIKPIQDPKQAAERLMQEAYQRGSADNITCVVVRFLANQGGTSRSSSG
ncbi:putative protein phosphatase 2C 59 [Prunus yedoensis var. nudiflora]|uniref:protein-serine/threonine phosphatase n=1 Tax=Prunus yedoensis var. nudiflora TaxID=2094558 RepID=A0A314UPK1_PRUYE|nr:putative protein phosphatase 2C 59 [Prunus yedoensis var. nudiflora]PQM39281.1 putative protein phosphatase 2C 59 [Prunus yedoensis var. nudiflora]